MQDDSQSFLGASSAQSIVHSSGLTDKRENLKLDKLITNQLSITAHPALSTYHTDLFNYFQRFLTPQESWIFNNENLTN